MVKKLLLLFIAATLLTQVHISFGSASDDDIIVQAWPKLDPISWEENGELKGFAVDLIEAVLEAQKIDHEYSIDIMPDMIKNIQSEASDMVLFLRISENFDKTFDFSTPIIQMSDAVFVRKNSPYETLEDLRDKEIIVTGGTANHNYLKSLNLTDKIIVVETNDIGVKLLASGKHDALFLLNLVGKNEINKLDIDNLEIAMTLNAYDFAFAVKDGNTNLLTFLNEGLVDVKNRGEYDRIYDEWFGVYEATELKKSVNRILFTLVLPLIAIALFIGLWSWVLKREVNARTKELLKANQELEDMLFKLNSTQDILVQQEKMAGIGRLVSGVTHEMNSPLGVSVTVTSNIIKLVEELKHSISDNALTKSDLSSFIKDMDEASRILDRQLESAIGQLNRLKETSVDQSNEMPREFELCAYMSDTIKNIMPKLKQTNHSISVSCPENVELYSYPGAISQIMINLINNALLHAFTDEMHGNMKVDISLDHDQVLIKFSDNGIGIPAEDINKIFEPFYTTKLGKGGSGLGLNIVYSLATQTLQGEIKCNSVVSRGTTFVLQIPAKIKKM